MKSVLLLFTLLLVSIHAHAYPSVQAKRTAVNHLETGGYHDLDLFNNLYLQCHSSSDALQLMKELDALVEKTAHRSLNHIAAASSISFLGDHSLALQQLRKMSSSLNSQTDYVRGEYHVLLGKISYRSENPKSAIRHINTGIKYLEKTNEKQAIQIAYSNLGLAHGAIDQHETALVYYDKADAITQNSSPKIQLYIRLNKALSLTSLKQHDSSKEAFRNALDLIYETDDYFAEVRTYGNLADIYIIEDSLALAEEYLKKGRKLATEQGFKLDLIRFDLTLAQLYKSMGKFEAAFLYLHSSDSIRNSLHIEQAAENVVKLEKLNQEAIDRLKQKSLKKTIELKKQKNWILWGGIIILSTLCALLLRQFLLIRRKNSVLLKKNLNDNKSTLTSKPSKKDRSLDKETLELIQSFEVHMIENRTFCKADLTQEKVAKKLGTNRTYLSKAINDHYGVSYSRWLNELRVSESKKMLIDDKFEHYSIEGIATSVGFSSLSTFNSNFKSITGLTPSYFRNNHSKVQ